MPLSCFESVSPLEHTVPNMAEPGGRSTLVSNTMWSLINESFVLVAATLSVLLLIPRLGSANYGAFAGTYALIGPFAAFAHSGITLTILEHTVGDDESVSAVIGSCLTIALAVAAALAPVVVVLGALFIHTLAVSTLVMFVFSELLVQAVLLSVATTVQGAYRFSAGIILRLGAQLLRMTVLVALVATHNVSLRNITFATGSALTLYTVVVILSVPRLGIGTIRPGKIDSRHFKNVFVYGIGLSASLAQNDGDKVALNAYGYRADSGMYAAAYRLLSMGMLPLTAFTSSAHFAVLRSVRDSTNQVDKARRFTAVGAVYAVPAMVVFFVAAPLVPHLLGDQFRGTATMLRWLAPILVIRGLMVFPLNGLLGLGRGRLRAGILMVSSVFAVLMYVLLIPQHTWRGAVVATLVSDTSLFIACWVSLIVCQRAASLRATLSPGDIEVADLALLTDLPFEDHL
jgi:O-antigen/teichoic acid export membrane protein